MPESEAQPRVCSYADAGVLIAGGTSGVGLASARQFVDVGVRRLVLLARDPTRGLAACAEVRTRHPDVEVTFVPVDAGDAEAVTAAVARAHGTLGSIDVLVNSTSAAYRPELLHRTPQADIAAILLGQALPPMLLTHAVLPIMQAQGGGSIVNIASDAAKVPTPGESVLGGAMAAIVMFSRVAALEGKRQGVRVNAVTPSLVAGTITAERVLADGFSRKLFDKATGQAHLGVAVPDDVAALVVFLGGPGAARMTGQVVSVNGGISVA